MTIDLSAYKKLYLETARKLVEEYTQVLSTQKADLAVQDILRIFHSLKGQSMAMGYKNLATLSLEVETYCRALAENKISLNTSLKDSLPSPKVFSGALDLIDSTNEEGLLTAEIQLIKEATEGIKQKQLSILLVEDDVFFQKVCIDKLQEKHALVDFSDNGEDAIVRIAAKKYDCILLDIIMPKKNGFDVLQFAKDNNIIPATPFIVFSTLGQEENIQKALSMGAVDFISKGNFDFDLLMSKIEAAINKKNST